MQTIKAVIFDLDGTIADTLPLCIAAFRKSIEPLIGKTLTDEEIIATFGPSEEGTVKALAPHAYEQGVNDYLYHYERMHDMCPEPFAGITDLMDTLEAQNIRLAMVTGKGPHSTKISLRRFGYDAYFEFIETGAPEGPRKPEGIANILNSWSDLEKEEVVYVGDAPSDIQACRSAGIPVVSACWAATAEAEQVLALQPDEVFYDIHGFSVWVEQHI